MFTKILGIPENSHGQSDTIKSDHIIEVNDITCGYGNDEVVLSNISFTIDKPGFVCIVGPNGVGKSTLIRCINGLIQPMQGFVKVMGKDVREYTLKDMAKVVGYVPAVTGTFNVMTVLDTVLVGRYAHQKWKTSSKDIQIAHKALRAMDIENLSMRNFNELSAGQHQKVALARGLVQEPRILILDEPTSNLDVRFQVYVCAFLKRLSERTGMTVLMINHDLNLAAKFADKIIVLESPGKIYSIGTPSEIIREKMLEDVYKVNAEIIDDHGLPHVVLQSII